MALHKALTIGDIHIPYQWTYADAAARTGATGFVSSDIGRFARQLDDNSIWMLTATTPTWIQIGSSGTVPAHATTHKNGGSDEVATATPAANAIPKAGADGKLASGFIPQIDHTTLSNIGTNSHSTIDTHLASTSNPHSTTASQVGLGSVTNDAQLKRAAADFATFTEKTTPVSADLLLIEDSAASGAKKKLQLANLPGGVDATAIHKATSGEISAMTEKTTPVSADVLVIEDSEASYAKKKVQTLNFRRWKQSAMAEVSVDTTSTSATWADLLTLNITTNAGYLLLQASAGFSCSNGSQRQMGMRLVVDGTPLRAVSVASDQTALAKSLALVHRVAVSSGAHTVKVQWIVGNGYTIRCRPVANPDSEHCVLTVQEVIA